MGGHVGVVHAKLETMWKSMICAGLGTGTVSISSVVVLSVPKDCQVLKSPKQWVAEDHVGLWFEPCFHGSELHFCVTLSFPFCIYYNRGYQQVNEVKTIVFLKTGEF